MNLEADFQLGSTELVDRRKKKMLLILKVNTKFFGFCGNFH